MSESYFLQLVDRSFEWLVTSGLRVMLVAVGMVVLMTLLKRGVERLRVMYEGTLPDPLRLKS